MVELSICINGYRSPELLKLCLDSIRKNVTGISYEIIVADSATEEATEMLMRENYPEIKFFGNKKNIGFQAMVKKCIENSIGEYMLHLNSDIIITKDSVEKLFNFIKENSNVGMVGPQLMNFNETLQSSCFRFYKPMTIVYRRTFLGKLGFAQKHLDWFLMKDYDHESVRDVDWLMGSALMVSRKSVEKVGLMDPNFFMYMEDVDWCRRFWENGYRVIYCPEAKMFHYHGKGSAKGGVLRSILSNKLTWVHISSAIKYFWKYRGKEIPKHN